MGLDGVAIVLAVEEEFGIAIDDADAANLTTPRRLADYVFERLHGGAGEMDCPTDSPERRAEDHPPDHGGRCLSQAGFYRLRAILVSRFGARRSEVLPDSPLQDFLRGDVRKQWDELGQAIGTPGLPGLECNPYISTPVLWGAPLAGAAYAFLQGMPPLAVMGVALGAWFVVQLALDRTGTRVPKCVRTVAALTPYVHLASNRPPAAWSREEVLRRVLQIVSMEIGFPIDAMKPDHRFVEDLGVD